MKLGSLILFASVMLNLPAAADEEHPKRVELVLDGSGSMWGQIDGEAKISIAKRTVKDLFSNWPEDTELGVSAYGHNQEGDCADIETLVPIGPYDKASADAAVSDITPLGKTPLTDAVRRAASRLSANDKGGSIILVTDGLETCGGDPCALGKELAGSGVSLKTHVIGFDLAGEDVSPLMCLARETGGAYFDAENASGLEEALKTATTSIALPNNVTLIAKDVGGNLLTEPEVIWQITSENDGEQQTFAGSLKDISLPPGDYSILAQHGEDMRLTASLSVPAEGSISKTLVFADGSLRMTAKLSQASDPLSGIFSWIMYRENPSGERVQIAREAGRTGRFTLPAGDYILEFRAEDLIASTPVTLIAEETVEDSIILDAGWIKAEAEQGASYTLFRLNADGRRDRAASEARFRARFLVRAGDYELVTQTEDGTQSERVTLIAGETVEVSF